VTIRSINPITLPLRRWLVLALAIGFFVPVFTTGVVAYHVIGLGDEPDSSAQELLRENASRWSDPAWQAGARDELAAECTDFVLMEDGVELYRSSPDPLIGPDGQSRERVVESIVISNDRSERVAYVYSEPGGWATDNTRFVVPIAAIASLLLTLGGIAWFLGRMVVKPLGSTSDAARQVAAGDLDGVGQVFAAMVGVVFLAVGVLGFIPAVTGDYQELRFTGHDSGAMLFGGVLDFSTVRLVARSAWRRTRWDMWFWARRHRTTCHAEVECPDPKG
jgi:hypothetical protein